MQSLGWWRWYMNVTIYIYISLYICIYIYHSSGHYPSSCLLLKKHDVSETGFFLRTGTSSIYWANLNRFHMKTETGSSLKNVAFSIKDRTTDNVKNCDSLQFLAHPTDRRCLVYIKTPTWSKCTASQYLRAGLSHLSFFCRRANSP
jgi:hypothetical protein